MTLPAGERAYDIEIRQRHQEVDGVVRDDKRAASLWNPRLQGDRLSFVIVDTSGEVESNLYCEGRIDGEAIAGVVRRGVGADQTSGNWRAVRVQGP
jgi:hypothetical protein